MVTIKKYKSKKFAKNGKNKTMKKNNNNRKRSIMRGGSNEYINPERPSALEAIKAVKNANPAYSQKMGDYIEVSDDVNPYYSKQMGEYITVSNEVEGSVNPSRQKWLDFFEQNKMTSTAPVTSSVYPTKNIFTGSTVPVYVDKPKLKLKKYNDIVKRLFHPKRNKFSERLIKKKNSIKLRKAQKLGL
jgi:hypothetical protein